jgi:Holliday junction resolvase RusA-like endonuclease
MNEDDIITVFNVFAEGIPKAQPRARAVARGGHARMYNPDTADTWKKAVKDACIVLARTSLANPIDLTLEFRMPRPKNHFKGNGGLKDNSPQHLHAQKPDADNLAKAVMDALSDIDVWQDDDQVCNLRVRKRWADKYAPSGCQIIIKTIKENPNL